MTTLELIKEAKRSTETMLNAANEKELHMWLGHALAYMEVAEKQAAADAEALERATQNYAYIDLLTEKERSEFLEKLKGCSVQALKVGENE